MEYLAKIIHKTHLSHLPTSLPVQFFGMPNGKVYFIYARYFGNTADYEFVFAEHKEFSFNYTEGKLMYHRNGKLEFAIDNEIIDKPDPQYTVFKVSKAIRSYTDAYNELNLMAREIINEHNEGKTILLNTKIGTGVRSSVS